jgi:hypothetical protein
VCACVGVTLCFFGIFLSLYISCFKFFGIMIRRLLDQITGLWPFYDEQFHKVPDEEIQDGIMHGKRPYVNPRFRNGRTYIESKLVEIMEKCWKQYREDRPLVFEVVQFLKEVKQNATRLGELHPSNFITIPEAP